MSGEEATGPVREPSKAPRLQLPGLPSPHGGAAVAGSPSREAAVPALRGVQRPFPEGRREGGAGKVALVAEEVGCPQSDQLTEAAVRRPLQAWLPGLPVCAGLTFCVGQPVPSCAGPRVAALLWACPARGLPLHKLRCLEGRGRTGGCACGRRGSWEHRTAFPATRGRGQVGFKPPQEDFGLSLELSIQMAGGRLAVPRLGDQGGSPSAERG